MKKTVAILLIAVMALSFVACSAKSKIVGTWTMTDTSDGKPPYTLEYEFTKDGKIKIAGIEGATYKINGNKITITGGSEDTSYTLKFSGKTMTMTDVEESSHWIKFTKK